jgi:hypothetical protein
MSLKQLCSILFLLTIIISGCRKKDIGQVKPAADSLKIGLLAYYPFSGNAGDSSGNANHGIINGVIPTADRSGKPNSAYDFSAAASYIDISLKTLNLTGNNPRTIASWIKPNETATSPAQPGVILVATGQGTTKISSENNGRTFNLRLNGASGGWNFSFMGYSLNNDFDVNPTSGDFISNKWTHVATTYANDTIKLFIDGKFQTSKKITLNTSGNDNFIGKNNHIGFESFFKGKIDEVRIYSRALNLTEIKTLAGQ